MKNLREKILDSTCPVIFYELLSPTNNDTVNVDAYVECAVDLLTSTSIMIDAVNIPEIREEENKLPPNTQLLPKMDARVFAQILEKSMYNHIEVVLNHCVVYESMEEQIKWIESSIQDHQIRCIILVGGGSSKIKYSGPSVLEIGSYIQNHYQQEQLFCGGITIQSRRSHHRENDEPFRLLSKGALGIDFFTSQIIYDPVCIKLLLRDYHHACKEQRIPPKRIFLSFAPISSHKDLNFLRWLGVSISKSIENELFKADIGIGWRSAKICMNLLQEILNFMQHEKIQVPIGLNIEHITRHNFELSLNFIERLGKLYLNHMAIQR